MEEKALVQYHKTAQQRAEIVAAFKQSGLSLNQFADEHQLTRNTLTRWVTNDARASGLGATELIEVPNPLASSGTTPTWDTACIFRVAWF